MISFKQFLNESSNTPLIIVDIQPAYKKYCNHIIQNTEFRKLINQQNEIVWFFNGEDLGLDSQSNLIDWLYELGYETEDIDKIKFIEKYYGYFRELMDENIDESIIIKIIRTLVMYKVNDSRDLNIEIFKNELGDDFDDVSRYLEYGVYLPDISLKELKELNGCYICGGGKNECLREIQLYMNAFNIKYKELKRFIY